MRNTSGGYRQSKPKAAQPPAESDNQEEGMNHAQAVILSKLTDTREARDEHANALILAGGGAL